MGQQNFVHSVLPRLPKLSLRVYIDSGEDNREETLEVRAALVGKGYTPGENSSTTTIQEESMK